MARRWPSTCCAPLGELWTRSRRKQIDCCRLVTRADSSRSFVCELRSPEASRVSCRSHRATGHHFSRCRESYFKGRAHARRQTVEYGVFVHPLVLSSGARHGPRIARPHGVTVLKLELSASTTTQAPAAMGAEGLITQEVLPAEPDSGSEGSSTPLCPPWRPAGARPRSSLSPR